MAVVIILSVAALILFIVSNFAEEWGDKITPIFFASFMLAIVCLIACIEIQDGTYAEGQKDALRGVQTYKIHYVYPEDDTIPSDTLYLEIK